MTNERLKPDCCEKTFAFSDNAGNLHVLSYNGSKIYTYVTANRDEIIEIIVELAKGNHPIADKWDGYLSDSYQAVLDALNMEIRKCYNGRNYVVWYDNLSAHKINEGFGMGGGIENIRLDNLPEFVKDCLHNFTVR